MGKTIYDIAEELGVAPSTVSKALNGKKGISNKTRKKIQAYAEKVRYYANANASKLKTKESYSIGIIYSEDLDIGLEHSFFSSILQSFKSYVESKGYEITFVINNLGNRKISYLDFCRQKNIDGVFIMTSVPNDPYLDELVNSEIACVSTDIYYNNVFTVISDNVSGAKQAVEHLYELGHRQIGHITEEHFLLAAKERMQGFNEAMLAHGLEVKKENIFTSFFYSFEHGYDVGRKFLKLDSYPTAMFAVSDIIAMGFIKALKDGGLRIPEDVSVIGFDDIPFAKYFDPKLTTIQQDTTYLGETAGFKLLELMTLESNDKTGIVRATVKLITRESTIHNNQ